MAGAAALTGCRSAAWSSRQRCRGHRRWRARRAATAPRISTSSTSARHGRADAVTMLAGRASKDHLLDSVGGGVAFLDYDRDGRPRRLCRERLAARRRACRREGASARSTRACPTGPSATSPTRPVSAVTGGGAPAPSSPTTTAMAGPTSSSRHSARNLLYRNLGNGTFVNVAAAAGIESPGWNTGAAFFDADGDGDLDLYIASYIDASMDDVLNAKRTLHGKASRWWRSAPSA